ncbi:MAG: PEP-utilizing enzyme [Candidatus Altiarchaeia archaeon]|jgi:phosphoenolpyruvate-protein kinase (PTS system EI component)
MAHAAIIAREMEIPCIVEADMSGVKEGRKLEVNGLSGEIRVLD